jgi:hypothetical protein
VQNLLLNTPYKFKEIVWQYSSKAEFTRRVLAAGQVSIRMKFAKAISSEHIKTGIFGQPELFDPKLTRHFLQYARRAHARISSSWHEPACMDRHA